MYVINRRHASLMLRRNRGLIAFARRL